MILFPVYIAAVWIPAYLYRRRALGFVIALLGPAPVMGMAWVIGLLMPDAKLAMQSWWLALYGSFALALGIGGLLLACAPRRAKPHQCGACHYDLRGNVTGVCPECGAVFDAAMFADADGVGLTPAPASRVPADPRAA